jgi:nitroimidazol reductase NimA-like FMN-containing flavoprotein (pyridoxamine 5'-phosphate oxidase superfamily)
MATEDHEVVSIYPYSDKQIDAIMTLGRECVLMWATKDGWPVGVTHAFVWHDGRAWITFSTHRHRAAAIRRDPRVSVVVSGAGSASPDCPKGSATMKGRAIFHDDRETKEWFYRALASKGRPDQESQDRFYDILDSPLRVILEVAPEKWITFDGDKSSRDREGTLREEEKGPRLSSDAVLMNKERARRGLDPR